MTADGFLNQKQRHPLAMTAAIAINLSAVTAVMLAKSGYIPVLPEGPIELINIVDPSIPEPDPTPKAKPRPSGQTYIPPKRVDGGTSEGTQIAGTDEFPTDFTTDAGKGDDGGTVIIPKVDPTPVPVLTDPIPLASAGRDFQPPYPPQLLRTGVEGKAVVRVLIGTDGRVKQVAIISADDPLFADATERQAMRKWRFKPATRDGAAVEAWKQMTVRFQITA